MSIRSRIRKAIALFVDSHNDAQPPHEPGLAYYAQRRDRVRDLYGMPRLEAEAIVAAWDSMSDAQRAEWADEEARRGPLKE